MLILAEVGVVVSMRFRDDTGGEHAVQMTKRLVTIPNVYSTETFASGGRVVGYVVFHDFFSFSNAQRPSMGRDCAEAQAPIWLSLARVAK